MSDEQQVVALAALLRPLSGPDPSGISLQYEQVYDDIKEARRSDDADAPRDIWSKDLKVADWDRVRELCEDALVRETKDLQVAAWLMEALLHLEGLRGLRKGVELLLQLSESYWETVHPALASGTDFRNAPFIWINEKLPAALGDVSIVTPDGDESIGATWNDWKRALWLDKVSARRPKDPDILQELGSSLTLNGFTVRCSKTPESFFREHLAVLQDTIDTIRALEAFLDDREGAESPSLVRFREALNEIHAWTKVVLGERSFVPDNQGSAEMSQDAGRDADIAPSVPGGASGDSASAPIAGRAEAYRMLLSAAQYLKEIEPHSPTPYLVLKAVSWGDMSLDDLLREFVREGLNFEALFTFLGIEPGDER